MRELKDKRTRASSLEDTLNVIDAGTLSHRHRGRPSLMLQRRCSAPGVDTRQCSTRRLSTLVDDRLDTATTLVDARGCSTRRSWMLVDARLDMATTLVNARRCSTRLSSMLVDARLDTATTLVNARRC
eukprot:3586267-Rhodomonas_salina.1